MKKALIVTNVLTLVLLYMSSFTGTKREAPKVISSNCDDIVMNYQNSPISGISMFTAQTMAKNYQGRFANTCVTPYFKLNHKNSKSVWFSLERLKSFVWELESRMCNKNCKTSDKPDSLGVRIYFGAYPNFNALSAAERKDYNVLPGSYIKYNSVFFVPTYYDSKNNINIDFDPRNMGLNECKPTPLSVYLKGTAVKYSGGGGVQSFNRFTMPPLSPSLILTANETQFFKGENPAKTFASINDNNDDFRKGGPANFLFPYGVQSIMNHGNIIPPEVDNGTAF